MKALTKKEMAEKIERLESQLNNIRNERKQMFNKYTFLNELEEDIKKAIESGEINDEDDIRERISQEIDNACIYYKTCFEIAMELNATSFDGFDSGIVPTDICQLAYAALDEYVNEEFDFSVAEDLIRERDSEMAED